MEDGKIDVDTWSNALNNYIQKNGISTLAIVCHPRMSKDRFKRINTKCVYLKNTHTLGKTIGHNSTLLLYLKWLGCEIDLIEIKDCEIPKDFKNIIKMDLTKFKESYNFASKYEDLNLPRYIN